MSLQSDRLYGVVRTALITYGVAVFTWLLTRNEEAGRLSATYIASGVLIQAALIAARAWIKRNMRDQELAMRLLLLVELIADGAAVMLFALGTFSAISRNVDVL